MTLPEKYFSRNFVWECTWPPPPSLRLCTAEQKLSGDLSGVRAEVFDDEGHDNRCPVVRVLFPRQPDARLANVADGGLRGWSGVGGRLGRAAEDDVVVGGGLDDQRGTPRRLTRLTQSLAGVPARVTLPQLCTAHRQKLTEQEQQRVAGGPGNAHVVSIRQVSSDAATLRCDTCGTVVYPRCCWR